MSYSQPLMPWGDGYAQNDATGFMGVDAGLVITDEQATAIGTAIGEAVMSAAQASSGVTAGATVSDTAVTLIAADAVNIYHHLRIFNTGSVAGFYSFNGGTTWHYLPANCSLYHSGVTISNQAVQIRRVAGGSNVTGVYASIW